MTTLETPLSIGGVEVPNRLYRAPVLECAGNGEAAVDMLIDELEPTAASGVGLLFQGASIVTDRGGCAAPNMTRVNDSAFVERLERLTGTVHDHGGRIFLQLAHGGLRSMATWHAEYRRQHPHQHQLAVSRPPWQLRALDRVGLISLQPAVLSTEEVWSLAEQFGRCAGYAVDAGYDGIHLSAANMSLIQQFLSPFYNRRDDEFRDGVRFLEAVHEAVREHAGDVPLVTKVPAETAAPRFVRRYLSRADGVSIAERAAAIGYDGLVPVAVSAFWDMSIVRGAFPDRAWDASDLQDDYTAVFGGRLRARAVRILNRLQARRFGHEPGWNADFCRAVRERVDVPVLLEGGLRTRADCDQYLGAGGDDPAADAVGMARPFYAEPRLGVRLLDGADALCESCNNCTVPQVTGEPGRCRTPAIVREQARLRRDGAYERSE
ncbi:NADH:flavin oxidoreductase [Haloarcula sp. CBA1130]|uniref:oxidoreductase n=1 Tax=unclassified Haloarcula TaxID=2624677 RepID=UPI001248FCB6|nr:MULTISPECIES: NADH:flavin oxidoreductase [unclassified Haloarcula]KAA9399281.1 NADH:flavin oxidoreductase [Haloarcula sp. CBA1129]KAA9403794.1 NADH:flavin oxidoreductase [Haloarcula sp. CBA1130]